MTQHESQHETKNSLLNNAFRVVRAEDLVSASEAFSRNHIVRKIDCLWTQSLSDSNSGPVASRVDKVVGAARLGLSRIRPLL